MYGSLKQEFAQYLFIYALDPDLFIYLFIYLLDKLINAGLC